MQFQTDLTEIPGVESAGFSMGSAVSAPGPASALRRAIAVCVLCALGMLVVTSLFASPAQRTDFRHGPVPAGASMSHAPAAGSHGKLVGGKVQPGC